MKHIASDGVLFQNSSELPSDGSIHSWRASNEDITFRLLEQKSRTNTYYERYEHVLSFFNAFKSVKEINPIIFANPDRIWDVDETAIPKEHGKLAKVFSRFDSHHRRYLTEGNAP